MRFQSSRRATLLLSLACSLPTTEAAYSSSSAKMFSSTCKSIKEVYKTAGCCGYPDKASNFQMVPMPEKKMFPSNPCAGAKPKSGFDNKDCFKNNIIDALEQSATNVTKGYKGTMNATGTPITTTYREAGLCPVNVHWHLGAEHLSVGEFDEYGTGPAVVKSASSDDTNDSRRLAGAVRLGHRCRKYTPNDAKFTTEYKWQHCVGMQVGETYEVHWPHSKGGSCGTPHQYQTPFYDGVFCIGSKLAPTTWEAIGVQSQTYTIVNDENYYYPDLIRGWIVEGEYGKDIAYYTGSTTGTSRNNQICSSYTPITWQVDRQCHLISASSFDKMCADMKSQMDDMSDDLHAHGSRITVADHLAADNHQRL